MKNGWYVCEFETKKGVSIGFCYCDIKNNKCYRANNRLVKLIRIIKPANAVMEYG